MVITAGQVEDKTDDVLIQNQDLIKVVQVVNSVGYLN